MNLVLGLQSVRASATPTICLARKMNRRSCLRSSSSCRRECSSKTFWRRTVSSLRKHGRRSGLTRSSRTTGCFAKCTTKTKSCAPS
uniref:Uncharacterized protein n=1 Tax=Hyaloperonospora arabidopsidis (strain Emoy2) TaxID=559515 RepID=M4BWZ9_HYAAE